MQLILLELHHQAEAKLLQLRQKTAFGGLSVGYPSNWDE